MGVVVCVAVHANVGGFCLLPDSLAILQGLALASANDDNKKPRVVKGGDKKAESDDSDESDETEIDDATPFKNMNKHACGTYGWISFFGCFGKAPLRRC